MLIVRRETPQAVLVILDEELRGQTRKLLLQYLIQAHTREQREPAQTMRLIQDYHFPRGWQVLAYRLNSRVRVGGIAHLRQQ